MHLAELFHRKPACSRLWVERRWPVVDGVKISWEFYRYPTLVGYDSEKRKFVVYDVSMDTHEASFASFIDPRFLEDKAWRISSKKTNNLLISEWDKKKDLKTAWKTLGLYTYSLRAEGSVLLLNDPVIRHVQPLRV